MGRIDVVGAASAASPPFAHAYAQVSVVRAGPPSGVTSSELGQVCAAAIRWVRGIQRIKCSIDIAERLFNILMTYLQRTICILKRYRCLLEHVSHIDLSLTEGTVVFAKYIRHCHTKMLQHEG